MGPSRKRPKISDQAGDSPSQVGSTTKPQPSTSLTGTSNNATKEVVSTSLPGSTLSESAPIDQLNSNSSWYSTSTWPRKSKPSTQVAKESILANKSQSGPSTADLSRFELRKSTSRSHGRPSSMCLGKGKETSDVTMGGTFEASTPSNTRTNESQCSSINEDSKLISENTPEIETQKDCEGHGQQPQDVPLQPVTSSGGWFGGWLGRSTRPSDAQDGVQEVTQTPETSEQPQQTLQQEQALISPNPPIDQISKHSLAPTAPSSWFGLWPIAPVIIGAVDTTAETPKPVKLSGASQDTLVEDTPVSKPDTERTVGSSWAFWSTYKRDLRSSEDTKELGQLAVTGEASQSRPEPAKLATVKEDQKTKSSKRARPDEGNGKATPSTSQTTLKTHPTNLLIPSVKSTYRLMENPSILQQLTRLLLQGQQRSVKHVFLTKDRPRIKKAVAIGVHGLFPAPLLRYVIGQPTGSIRFASHAAAAIRRWADQHGFIDCEIEKIALEGEGKIAERVDNLWKLLLNWIDHVRQADLIFIACHSQGVPVALLIVAKLIEFGVVTTGKIAVCAMAGISLGPFAQIDSQAARLFSGAAGELFEFSDPESVVSKRYEDALRVALKFGTRVLFCGSIDDQLVSLESAIMSVVSHPYIFRMIYVDGRNTHASNFLSHLIGFALKLRNLGVSDHGLIRELSASLAGSLYTGDGHSRLYDDERVYDLAIEFALETTSVGNVPLDIQKYEVPTNTNPYVLPWIMRGLLEEDFVKTELDAEVTELLKQFDDWKPTTKVLRDVKYRLEAVRSKL